VSDLTVLYRGPLASCNFRCRYCPFRKFRPTAAEIKADKAALRRFVRWAARPEHRLAVLFTPWGEAIVHERYQSAIVRLTQLENVTKVAVQTNLSGRLAWVRQCDVSKLALWCSYHPGQMKREKFLRQCRTLDRQGVRYSVGMVGIKKHVGEAIGLRRQLPRHAYLWINAYKDVPGYYTEEEFERWERIDPLFRLNTKPQQSLGRDCRAGESVIAVDGDGTIRRCHFVDEPLGNLYASDLAGVLARRPCPNATCGCHIGYVHMHDLDLYSVFKDGILERIPYSPTAQ
jgi:hypothetical protein